MQVPFISFRNEDIIYDLNYEPLFLSAIEIMLFRYMLMFKNNKVEKLIAFYKNEGVSFEEIENHRKLLKLNKEEIFMDNSSLDNKVFMHITHSEKIKENDLTILERYINSFSNSIYNVKVNLDKYCPFAISFSFNYNPKLIRDNNVKRYNSLINLN